MTDKLYFCATECRVNDQPDIFMRTQLLKKLNVLLLLGLAWCSANFSATAQIAVGTNGSPFDVFGSRPPASSWSTKTLPGAAAAPESELGIDEFVNGSTNAASTI